MSRRIAKQFDDDSDEERVIETQYEINMKDGCIEYLRFLKGLFMPLVEAYVITTLCLDKLVNTQLLENELIMSILDEMKRQLATGSLKYGKSLL